MSGANTIDRAMDCHKGWVPRWVRAAAGGLVLVLLAAAASYIIWKFPFRRDAVVQRIEAKAGARVEIGSFVEKWFPPGFAARNLRLSDRFGDVATIATFTVKGSYIGLMRTPAVLSEIDARDVHLIVPQLEKFPFTGGEKDKDELAIDAIRLSDFKIDFPAKRAAEPPPSFLVHELSLKQVGPRRAMTFRIALRDPTPSGDIRSEGKFGPLNTNDVGLTPLAGTFTFEHADLTVDGAISGILNASGKFQGRIDRRYRDGRHTAVSGIRQQPLHPYFSAMSGYGGRAKREHGTEPDRGALDRTTVSASGNVMSATGRPGKTTTLNVAIDNGRVEDLLLIFSGQGQPAMKGAIHARAKFVIPPGPPDFLTRLGTEGAFDIARAFFTNANAQELIDRLSASAQGESKREETESPKVPPAEIHAFVVDRNGVASLRNVVFEAPGVISHLDGTFGLHDKSINMNGVLQTSGKLFNSTSGVKELMLKIVGPLWKKRASVKFIPYHIGGNASHPIFTVRLPRLIAAILHGKLADSCAEQKSQNGSQDTPNNANMICAVQAPGACLQIWSISGLHASI